MKAIRLAGLVFASLIAAATARAEPVILGSQTADATTTGVAVLISASSNTTGITIKTAVIFPGGPGPADLAAIYPSGAVQIFGVGSNTPTSAFSGDGANLPYPIYLPPGIGLEFAVGTAAPSQVAITYDPN